MRPHCGSQAFGPESNAPRWCDGQWDSWRDTGCMPGRVAIVATCFLLQKNPWSIFLVWKLSMERQDPVSSNKSWKKKKTQSETKCVSKGRFQKLSQSEYLTCYLQHLSHCARVHASRAWSHSLALSNQPWPGVGSWIVPHWDDQNNCFHWNTCQQHMSELWKWIPKKKALGAKVPQIQFLISCEKGRKS